MEASSMAMGELADTVLPHSLAHRVEPGLNGFPFFNTTFPPGGPFALPFNPVLLPRRELQDGML